MELALGNPIRSGDLDVVPVQAVGEAVAQQRYGLREWVRQGGSNVKTTATMTTITLAIAKAIAINIKV